MYKVLIVDDEPLARQGLIETIDWSEYGFEIAGDTDNATSAKEMCQTLCPDVIITDICMEPIDGLTLIEQLREENPDLEFIVISGYGEFSYAQRAMKYGVSTYILKPIENEDLTNALIMLKSKLEHKNKINKIIEEYTDKLGKTNATKTISESEKSQMPGIQRHEYSIKQSTPVFSTKQTEDFLEAITLNKQNYVRELIESYFTTLIKTEWAAVDEVKNSIISVSVYIIQRYIKAPEMMQTIFGRTIHPAKEVWELETIDEIRAWLTAFTDTLMDNKQIKEFSLYSPLVQNAISYIMSNYSKDCDINLVANKFYVSSGHLMRQFKQETGKTFLEYLTEYRINISITLLQSKNYKIYQVCAMVGYTNTKYFGKIFKKVTGKNPKDYII